MAKKTVIIIGILFVLFAGTTMAFASGLIVSPTSGNYNRTPSFEVNNLTGRSVDWHLDCRADGPNYQECLEWRASHTNRGSISNGGSTTIGMGDQCWRWQLDFDLNGDGIDDVGYVVEPKTEGCDEKPEESDTPVVNNPKKLHETPENPNTDGCVFTQEAKYQDHYYWTKWTNDGGETWSKDWELVDQTTKVMRKLEDGTEVVDHVTFKFPPNYTGLRAVRFTLITLGKVAPADHTPEFVYNADTCEEEAKQATTTVSCPNGNCPEATCRLGKGYFIWHEASKSYLGVTATGQPLWFKSYQDAKAAGLEFRGSECGPCTLHWAVRGNIAYFAAQFTPWDIAMAHALENGRNWPTQADLDFGHAVKQAWIDDGSPLLGRFYAI